MSTITFKNVTDLRDSIKMLRVKSKRLHDLADFFEFIFSEQVESYCQDSALVEEIEDYVQHPSDNVSALALGTQVFDEVHSHTIADLITYADNVCSDIETATIEDSSITFDLHYKWMREYAAEFVESCIVE